MQGKHLQRIDLGLGLFSKLNMERRIGRLKLEDGLSPFSSGLSAALFNLARQ
jgi:hypothetical protein